MARSESTIDEHGQTRDRRGEWRSGRPANLEPLLDFPTSPKRIVKWLFGVPGFFLPWFALYMLLITISFWYFTPALTRMASFEISWMLEILARNIVILIVWTGAFHLWLYGSKKQGRITKYNGNWMARDTSVFLFNDQVKDNMFWAIASGAVTWTAYECVLWWCYANSWLPTIDFASNPIWFLLWMFLIPIWRNFHFYWIHRLLHWKPLYDFAHYIHHKNVNVGPWSGMAMHPFEHLLYFSSMLIHLVVASHPLHMMFNGFQTGLGPALSHSGFDELVFGDKARLRNDRYLHYLHHRHHNVNYGESNVPLDKWLGSYHDGSPEADAHFKRLHQERLRALKT